MSVMPKRRTKQTKDAPLTAHERLAQIDARIAAARADVRELERQGELAAQAVQRTDAEAIRLRGAVEAGQAAEADAAAAEEAHESARREAGRDWAREGAIAQAKLTALTSERAAFVAENIGELAAAVRKRAEELRAKQIANVEERGQLAAESVAVVGAWHAIGLGGNHQLPIDALATEWRREAKRFDPASIPLMAPDRAPMPIAVSEPGLPMPTAFEVL